MHVSVETLEGLKRRLTVQLPAEQFDNAYQQRLKSLARSAKMDGFRKGKVPLNIIRQRYGDRVKQEILADLIQRSYDQAIRQQNLSPAGTPKIDSRPPGSGEDVTYTAVIEVLPEFELADLGKLSIEKPAVEITDRDVDNTLEKLREQRAWWEPVERAAGEGDRVRVDFEGTVGGEPFEGGRGEDVAVVLGAGRMLGDFEAGLEGVSAGEQRRIEITFPEDYAGETLRGKAAVFEVSCREVAGKRLPEPDEEFARSFDVADGSLETLKANIRKQLEAERTKAVRAYLREQTMEGLAALHDIELPEALVEEETDRMQRETAERLGLKESDLNRLPREEFEKRARRRVTLRLVIARLVRQRGIEADREAVRRRIEETVVEYENPDRMLRYFLKDPKAQQHFQSLVLEERVIDEVAQTAQTTDKAMSFDELMQAVQA